MGIPAKVRRDVTPEEEERFRKNWQNYVAIAALYKKEEA
jgi:carbonic anhydrase/acetyltransferase-like protein (isoleucine patch superfamily)